MREFRRAFGITSGILAALIFIPLVALVITCSGLVGLVWYLTPVPPPPVEPPLVQMTHDADATTRAEGYRGLRDMGAQGVPYLLDRLPESATYLENAELTKEQLAQLSACLKRPMPKWQREEVVAVLRSHERVPQPQP